MNVISIVKENDKKGRISSELVSYDQSLSISRNENASPQSPFTPSIPTYLTVQSMPIRQTLKGPTTVTL